MLIPGMAFLERTAVHCLAVPSVPGIAVTNVHFITFPVFVREGLSLKGLVLANFSAIRNGNPLFKIFIDRVAW